MTNTLARTNRLANGLLDHFMKPNRDDLFYPFQQLFDRFYEEFYNGLTPSNLKSKTGFPRWDIYEANGQFVVDVALTGCEPEDISVEILPAKGLANLDTQGMSRMLRVSGRVSEDHQFNHNNDVKYAARELRRSAFERSALLPNYVEGDPEATWKNGLLKLTWNLPEQPKEPEVKRIEIKKL